MNFRIAMLALVLAFSHACNRIERLDIPTEEEVRHKSLQDERRTHCVKRLDAIRKELLALPDHPWGGEYSWLVVRTCGSCPQHAETIALSPKAGAVWWYQGSNLADALEIDEGDIVSIDDDHIVVRWDIGSRSPHINREPRGGLLLDDELVRVKWDTSDLLIPLVRMPRFCGAVSSGYLDSRSTAPRRGGWRWSWGNLEDEPEPTGWPHVPVRWQEYLVRTPIRAVASIEEAPRIIGAYGPMPWKDDSPTLCWRCTALIDVGRAGGVRPGMSLLPQEPDSSGSWRSLGIGEVFRVEENKAWIAFSGYAGPKEGPPCVGSHLTVATTAPPPR